MDGNKYLKGSELGAAAADFVAKDAPAEEVVPEEVTAEEPAEEASSDSKSEPEVTWRTSGDSSENQ